MEHDLQVRGGSPPAIRKPGTPDNWVEGELLESRTLTDTVEPFYCVWKSMEKIFIPQAMIQITRATYRLATLDETLEFRDSGGLSKLRKRCLGLLILNESGEHLAALHRDGTISGWNEDSEYGIKPWEWAVATVRKR